MNTREFDAMKHEESAKRVLAGHSPVPRMSVPTLYARENSVVYLASGSSGAVRAIGWNHEARDKDDNKQHSPALQGVSATRNLTSTEIANLFTSTSLLDVCFVDRASLLATVKILSASKIGTESRVGRVVKYLAAQPAMSRCSVLTTTLAQKYWTPTDFNASDFNSWAAMFKVDPDFTRFERAKLLAEKARAGKKEVIPAANFTTSSNIIANSLLRWSGAKVEAFTAVQNHNDLWEAVCGSDPLLYERGLLIGSTARIVPVSYEGGVIEAEVSTPFKLRPGSNITVFGGVFPKGLPVRLNALDFNADTGKLIAKIIRVAKKPKRGEPDGFFFLSDDHSRGKEFFAINEPFTGGGGFTPRSKSSDGKMRSRDIPLDVSLAASVEKS